MANAQKAQDIHDNYVNVIDRWSVLSSGNTVTGEFLNVMKLLGGLSEDINKILGTVENTIKIMGL